MGRSRLLLLALCCGAAYLSRAASGVVKDPTDAAVPGAAVLLKTSSGTLIRTAQTGPKGQFVFENVPPGTYIVAVAAEGFRQTEKAVKIEPDPESEEIVLSVEVAGPVPSVTVTSKRGTADSAADLPQLVTVSGRDELTGRVRPTIAHALENAPGVMLQQTTQGAVSPFLRGLTGYQTLLMLDGVRFNTSVFRSGPNQYLGWLDAGSAGRIEAALGPGGAAFGSDSMGGTVNVITADPSIIRGGALGLHGEFDVQGATADFSGVTRGRLLWAGKRLTWTGGGAASRYNDVRAGHGFDSRNAYRRFFGLSSERVQEFYGDRLQDTGFLRTSLDTRASYRITDLQSLTLYYQHADDANVRSYRDQYGGIGRIQASYVPQTLDFSWARYEKLKLGFLDSVSGVFSVNSQKDGFIQRNQRFSDPVVTDDSYVRANGYAGQATTQVGKRQAVVFGAETYHESISSYRFQFDPVSEATAQQRALYPNGSTYLNTGIFAQDSIDCCPIAFT